MATKESLTVVEKAVLKAAMEGYLKSVLRAQNKPGQNPVVSQAFAEQYKETQALFGKLQKMEIV